jgi:hypothetical protein
VTDPRWLRAGGYFAVCLVVSALSGVLGDLGDTSAAVLPTVGCLLVVTVAYGVIWPIGTFALDRPRDVVSPLFGLVWGFCEAQLLLAGYLLVELLDLPRFGTVALAFLLLSAFQGVWHAAYWDVKVAPEHNIPEWNARKVLLCHVPNLAATLTHYAVYGSAFWFVVFQVVALTLSATAMRFPRPARELSEA